MIKLAQALVKAQSEMGNAVKDSKNPFFKSKYADLNSIREAVLPVLNKHGIAVLQPIHQLENGQSVVRTTLLHESGEMMTSDTKVVVAKQNDPQAEGSGISYARRYGLQSFLNIGAEDDDGEGAMNRTNAGYAPKMTVQSTSMTTAINTQNLSVPTTTNISAGQNVLAPATTEAPKKSTFKKQSAPAPVAPAASTEEDF